MKFPVACGLIAALSLVACSSTGSKGDASDPGDLAPAPDPWPSTFEFEGGLIADELWIEGPPALRDHLALMQDPATQIVTQETTPEGLRIVTVARPGAGPARIGAQLDRIKLAATRRMTVLERPGNAPVIVEGRGNVFFVKDGVEERGPLVRLVGE